MEPLWQPCEDRAHVGPELSRLPLVAARPRYGMVAEPSRHALDGGVAWSHPPVRLLLGVGSRTRDRPAWRHRSREHLYLYAARRNTVLQSSMAWSAVAFRWPRTRRTHAQSRFSWTFAGRRPGHCDGRRAPRWRVADPRCPGRHREPAVHRARLRRPHADVCVSLFRRGPSASAARR